MRHAVKGRKLGRTSAHREALFRNQLASLIENERIVTTLPKAKELRPIAEKVITHGKESTVATRRWVERWIPSSEARRTIVKKVFDEIAPRFTQRSGGYLRIVKLGPRLGDGAEMAVLEFVDRELTTKGTEAAATASDKKEKKAGPAKDKPVAAKKEKPVKEKAKKEAKSSPAPKTKGKAGASAPKAAPRRTKKGEGG